MDSWRIDWKGEKARADEEKKKEKERLDAERGDSAVPGPAPGVGQASGGGAQASQASAGGAGAVPMPEWPDTMFNTDSAMSEALSLSRGELFMYEASLGVPKKDGKWLEPVPMSKDGNCLFSSVFNSIKVKGAHSTKVTAVHLRRHVLVFMARNLEYFLHDILADTEHSWDVKDGKRKDVNLLGWFHRMLKSTSFAGEACLKALGMMMKQGLWVYRATGRVGFIEVKFGSQNGRDVCILHDGWEHYSGLGVYF